MIRLKLGRLGAAQILVPVGVLLIALTFLASPGLFNIDEVVILAGARAFQLTGGLAVPNGWPEFQSPDLNLWIMVSGPNGLAPQYPPGSAVLGGPLLAALGVRGLILINVLASVGALFALWALASRHFGGKAVALASVLLLIFATFWLEYAYAVWPHAVGVLAVTLSLLLLLDSLDAEGGFGLKALGAGAAIGVGLLFRTDTILAVPALGLIAILFARRPFRIGTLFGVGLLPFVGLAAWANLAKFGTLNPLSYGHTDVGGGTTFSTHLIPMALLALTGLLVVAARLAKWRPRARDYAVGLFVVIFALFLSDAVRGFMHDYLKGAWALLVDATTVPDRRQGIVPLPGGLLYFWGLWKKALGQSMPWLGLLLLAIPAAKDTAMRRLSLIVLILCAVWSLPFFVMAWHGGMGSNMRYLLPLLPALCALAARLLLDFARATPGAARALLVGGLLGVAAVALWAALHPTHAGGAHQILPVWILALVAALVLLASMPWRGQAPLRVASLGAIGCGLTVAMILQAADFQQAQSIRASADAYSHWMAKLPDRALVYTQPTRTWRWSLQPGHLTAMRALNREYDYRLIDTALAKGYRVLISRPAINDQLRKRYGPRLVPSGLAYRREVLIEIRPASASTAKS